jgi:hypothetical protein
LRGENSTCSLVCAKIWILPGGKAGKNRIFNVKNNKFMDRINILWTTGDKITALNMLAVYVLNAKARGWWQEINVIIWGASAKLVAEDTQVQTEVLEMIHSGIHVEACKDCSDACGVTGSLKRLGVNVRFMGQSLTDYIKAGEPVLTV